MFTHTTWGRSSTVKASRFAPATTAHSPSCSISTCLPRRARRLPSTTRERKSTSWQRQSRKSSRCSVKVSELSELYQQVILDHNKKPRNFRKMETANRRAEGFNPLCGDQLIVY